MGRFLQTQSVNLTVTPVAETLHTDFATCTIRTILLGYHYIDRDTNQHIRVIPALDITGYGSTAAKAAEMLRFSLDQFFKSF